MFYLGNFFLYISCFLGNIVLLFLLFVVPIDIVLRKVGDVPCRLTVLFILAVV